MISPKPDAKAICSNSFQPRRFDMVSEYALIASSIFAGARRKVKLITSARVNRTRSKLVPNETL